MSSIYAINVRAPTIAAAMTEKMPETLWYPELESQSISQSSPRFSLARHSAISSISSSQQPIIINPESQTKPLASSQLVGIISCVLLRSSGLKLLHGPPGFETISLAWHANMLVNGSEHGPLMSGISMVIGSADWMVGPTSTVPGSVEGVAAIVTNVIVLSVDPACADNGTVGWVGGADTLVGANVAGGALLRKDAVTGAAKVGVGKA
eukprot:CAMPEP_0178670326 /NCGR_PEP_ID=MMETSP0698-20121128/32595_1 /TAXON_ID=265572 /ORGANISM="Extubocellulus spinifer, Strain CCMP396" /LENGTH=207 /DNA_ID=CAMNT_0020314035 /DNA_START=194 /DNA_END=816 /DNA_ORIENTATION=-